MKVFAAILLLLTSLTAFAQLPVETDNIVKKPLSQAEVDKMVKTFTQNETVFRQALNNYVFNRYATIQTIGLGGQVTGTYRRDSFMAFNEAGERFEKILFFPMSTITELTVTNADIDNLGGINPFAIEPKLVDQYKFEYIGTEKFDPFDTYVFEVGPKAAPDAKQGIARFFQGRIWVDKDEMMIVRTKGKAVPEGKERFPIVETFRSNIDDKYYFPVLSRADDTLVFPGGSVHRLRVKVRYEDYKLGRTDVRILDDDPTPTPSPTPKKPSE
jgi:hypothetical protein